MRVAVGVVEQLIDLLLLRSRPKRVDPNVESAYFQLALQAVIEPKNINAIPMAKLLKFRRKHQDGMVAFRSHVSELVDELGQVANVENPAMAQAHLQALYDKHTRPQLNSLRREMAGIGIDTAIGTLAAKVDPGAAAGTLLGGVAMAGGNALLGGAAVALAVVPHLASMMRAKPTTPVSYLLAADRKLGTRSILERLR
ncbi:DUF6236 family protein [Actinophytocola xanthii]|uniref:DUF6236 family protein n=1 Tax=Actinophytocola xanthii TaxID=1912961 RepID=UPI0011775A4B